MCVKERNRDNVCLQQILRRIDRQEKRKEEEKEPIYMRRIRRVDRQEKTK